MMKKSYKDSHKNRTSDFISDNKNRLLDLAERLESINCSSSRKSPNGKNVSSDYKFK